MDTPTQGKKNEMAQVEKKKKFARNYQLVMKRVLATDELELGMGIMKKRTSALSPLIDRIRPKKMAAPLI